jgi:O-antigen/teichoic acid export membrane protein
MSHSVAKNTVLMTLASVGQKIISFVYFTVIARSIGVEGTGKYFFALSFTTIFVVFVDLGFTNVLVREAAKAKSKIQEYFSLILATKIVLAIFTYLAAVITINLLGYPIETRHLVYLSAVTMLFDSFHLTFYGVLRSIGDLKYEAISITVSQFLTLILGSIFLYFNFSLIYLIAGFTIPSAINALYAGIIVHYKYGINLKPRYDRVLFQRIAAITIPFAIAAILARLYSYIDSIILSRLAGDTAVGWYSIPYKITYAFQFIPLALVAALYPRFSEYYEHNQVRLVRTFQEGTKYLLLIVCPLAVGISVLAQDIILQIYTSDYLPSVLPLQILMAGLIFSFVSFPIGALLNACDRQKTQTMIVAGVLLVNIVLNIFFIPIYGIVAAAIAALVGNILLTVIGYLCIPRITPISHRFFLRTVLQVSLSTVIMGIVVFFIKDLAHFTIAILAGMVVYIAMLFFVRAISRSDVAELQLLLKRSPTLEQPTVE